MAALLLASVLALLLLVDHFSAKKDPLPTKAPLDKDRGLWIPALGHASSVFSLTALFGAYLLIALLIGFSALVGTMVGNLLVLFYLKTKADVYIDETGQKSFESFIATKLVGMPLLQRRWTLWYIAAAQFGFAVSELVILNEVATQGFDLAPRHASVFTLGIALAAYLYLSAGGYRALFKTDLFQFILVFIMCIAAAIEFGPSLSGGLPAGMEHLWQVGIGLRGFPRELLKFGLGAGMGWTFLIASPDAWKRIFVISIQDKETKLKGRIQFSLLIVAGILPFVFLIPLALHWGQQTTVPMLPKLVDTLSASPTLNILVLLGLTSAFLSSFDSTMLTSVHLSLLAGTLDRVEGPRLNLSDYRMMIGKVFLALIVTFLVVSSFVPNSFLPGLFLIGPYAIIGGIVTGTCMMEKPLRYCSVVWETSLGTLTWMILIFQVDSIRERFMDTQAEFFPLGGGVAILYYVLYRTRWKK